MKSRLRSAVAALAAAAAAVLGGCDRAAAPPQAAATANPPVSSEAIERGRTLAILGNCAGCHTARGGADYAGGPALRTPFGVVYGSNLTPDDATGLGRWSADDFWQALHQGRSRDGRALVPAFPYTAFTHLTRQDSDDLQAYLRSLPAVRQASPPQALRFPYGTAMALRAWQWLNFDPADVAAESAARARLPPRQARGAYLVQGLGHCAACHAPRNAFGAPAADPTGSLMPMQDWYAPSLHPVAGQPVVSDQTVTLLKTGQSQRGAALGPMALVIFQSTQHWPEADLQAVAEYLASLPPEPAAPAAQPAPDGVMQAGRALYRDGCADCHGERGEGVPGAYPALAGNPTVAQPTPLNLVNVLRHGGFPPATAGQPRPFGMPPQRLSDRQAADVLTYVRQAFGPRASAVTELEVLGRH